LVTACCFIIEIYYANGKCTLLFSGPAKNYRRLAPVSGPAVEKHCHRRVHVFGDAKNFCPNVILFFPNKLSTANLNVKTKMCHCKKIKVPACLIILVVIPQKHFTASTICCLQKLGLDGMVGYHHMFLILRYF